MDPTTTILAGTIAVVVVCFLVMAFKKTPSPPPVPVDDSKGKVQFTVFYPHLKLSQEGVTHMIITDSQKVPITVSAVDKKGNPASFDGVPAWSSSDEAILTLNVGPDGLSAEALAVGPLGHAQVLCSAVSAGSPISGTLEIDVVSGAAVTLNLAAGTPIEQ
jgi:hypothetical protein